MENRFFLIRKKIATTAAEDTRALKSIHASIVKAKEKGADNLRPTEKAKIAA